jgi:hypothetical protein
MSSNILGLNNIINKDKINSSIHLKDKEIDMLSNLSFDMSQTEDNNNANLYDKDIKDIANEIGINLDNLEEEDNNTNLFNDLKLNTDFNLNNNDDVMSVKSFRTNKTTKTATIPSFNTFKKETHNPFMDPIPPSPTFSVKSNNSNKVQQINNFNKIVNKMNNKNVISNNKNYINNIYEEEIKNKKAMLIEQIQLLKLLLEENGDNVDNIPDVNEYDELKKLEHIHRILKIKKDRSQFSTMGEEILLFFVHLLENVFDGKTTYFGKYTPDIKGWNTSVRHRLRRNRFETSTIVSNFVESYQLSPHSKLLLDLVPSMFLYAYQKGTHISKFSKKELNDNLSSINNM